MRNIFVLLMVLLTTTLSAQDSADFVLPSLISDHAVMKRDASVKLWGWCPAQWELKIVCSWAAEDTVRVKSNKQNYWETIVHTPREEGPHSIKFYGWDNQLCESVDDILMGEPWLCSGQSNMEYCFKWRVDDVADRSSLFKNNKIRIFKVAKAASRFPVERISGKWEIIDARLADDFSVAAYFFGKRLNEALSNVPIGLIGSYWGGTAIEPWMDDESWKDSSLTELSKGLQPSWAPTANSSLYHAMIFPLLNYQLSGVIWYQGEANVERVHGYRKLFPAMIKGWRKAFNQVLPFYFVQIAPWSGYSGIDAAIMREIQSEVVQNVTDTGMAVISDLVNDIDDIHPALKKQVGERLANIVLKEVYKQNIQNPYSPTCKSWRVIGKHIHLATTAGKYLVHTAASINKCSDSDRLFTDRIKEMHTGTDIPHFELIGSDGRTYSVKAFLRKNGEIVLQIPNKCIPSEVRYCFTNDAEPTLFNVNNGLPLASFRIKIDQFTQFPSENLSTGQLEVPRICGSFIQEFLVKDWSEERWDQEMQMMINSGMEYLIFAPTLLTHNSGTVTSSYPSLLSHKSSSSDLVEVCLRSAQKAGIKVFLGLNFNERWWKVDYDGFWLLKQMQEGNLVAKELFERYKHKYPDAMYGWYWVWEIDNYNAASKETQQILAEALNLNLDFLSILSPGMPLMLSPFMNYRLGTAEQCRDLWINIFAQTRFRNGDIFSPQDCIGAGGLNLEVLDEWFKHLKSAVETKPELTFWANTETFEQAYWTSASLDRLVRQLQIVHPYVENILSFAYCHYYSPLKMHPDYHAAYLEYCQKGRLSKYPAAKKVCNVKQNALNRGIRLSWQLNSRCKHTVGFSIYKNGELFRKVRANSTEKNYQCVDVEGTLRDKYIVSSYNVLGQESL